MQLATYLSGFVPNDSGEEGTAWTSISTETERPQGREGVIDDTVPNCTTCEVPLTVPTDLKKGSEGGNTSVLGFVAMTDTLENNTLDTSGCGVDLWSVNNNRVEEDVLRALMGIPSATEATLENSEDSSIAEEGFQVEQFVT